MMKTIRLLVLLLLAASAGARQLPEATEAGARPGLSRPAVAGQHGLVVAGHPLASMAGARTLLKGGSAADAAVAILATLNVVEPEMSGAGGNGFMLVYDRKSGKIYSLSMTGAAPKALRPEAMTAETLSTGIDAAPVPGLFGGWIAVLERFGTLPLGDILQPAINYAENGFPVDPPLVRSIESRRADLQRFPTSARIFLPTARPPAAGDLLKNRDLAATFRKLIDSETALLRQGRPRTDALRAAHDRFYRGDIAAEIVRFTKEAGGSMSAEDLASYQPLWSEALHTTYRGYDVYSTPPTSRGGLEVLMQLNLVESYDLKSLGAGSAAALHLQAEAIKVAKSDVYRYVADPRLTRVPTIALLSKEYAAARRKLIDAAKAGPYPEPGMPQGTERALRAQRAPRGESVVEGHTTSFSVVDQAGNAVVCTPTLGSGFGTAVVVGSTGLLFNNGLRTGSTAPYSDHPNYVRPGQVPLLNNSPILVFKGGRLVLTLGSPGGETIGQTQFQVLINVLDFEMRIQEAIEAPRFALDASPNFYKPGAGIRLRIEQGAAADVIARLRALGHSVSVMPRGLGSMQGILVDPKTGTPAAGADPRRLGYAIGW
jgi:gamma-glutamyltranspeptidase / glutathione hydrolase